MKILALISMLAFIWVFYEVWFEDKRRSIPGKLLWTFGALFFSILTALLYFFYEKRP